MPTNPQGDRHGLTIALRPDQHDALKAIAKARQEKVSPMLRPVIDQFIQDNSGGASLSKSAAGQPSADAANEISRETPRRSS